MPPSPARRPWRAPLVAGATLALLLLLWAAGGRAAAPRGWPEVGVATVVGGLPATTHITHAGDGSGRLFVSDQWGRVWIVQGETLLPQPFLDIRERVRCCGEEGFLSVAFPPDFAAKQHFYAYYTELGGSLQISRFDVPPGTPNVADPASEAPVLTIPHPGETTHNGGQLAFGPDGYLYLFTGDGGGVGDPHENAQDLDVLLGKVLRIDVEGATGGAPYRVPPTNPFVGAPGRDEIWAYGLRNPWRASFDRATGDLYIADVGQAFWEEVSFQPAASAGGENYGWDCYEGSHPYELAGCSADPASFVFPVSEYPHGPDCSITGGYVYRGRAYLLDGLYFYTDACTGRLRALRRAGGEWESAEFATLGFGIATFGEDEAGELYLARRSDGTLLRLTGPAAPTPTPTATLDPTWQRLTLPIIIK